MKNTEPIFNLTPEELAMEASVDWDATRTLTQAEKDEWAAIARNTLAKKKAITIRISERTLMRLKAAAAREGLPYQTFVASLIHKNT
jgi:predicted DNA binding CopG/RHH family protein